MRKAKQLYQAMLTGTADECMGILKNWDKYNHSNNSGIKQFKKHLDQAIAKAKINAIQFNIIELSAEGLTVEEIAESLKVDKSKVTQNRFRLTKELKVNFASVLIDSQLPKGFEY